MSLDKVWEILFGAFLTAVGCCALYCAVSFISSGHEFGSCYVYAGSTPANSNTSTAILSVKLYQRREWWPDYVVGEFKTPEDALTFADKIGCDVE